MNKKIITRLKTGAVMFAVAGAMAFSGAAGVVGTAKADSSDIATYDYGKKGEPNTNNTLFIHGNNNSVSYSPFRYKYNSTRVYIYPTEGPMLYYRVQGANTEGGSGTKDMSKAHGASVGIKASFQNNVKAKGASYAKLKRRHSVSAPIDSKGWWSPDSTMNYSLYD